MKGFIIVLVCILCCFCDVLDVKNVCKAKQDLDFIPIGYSCTFTGSQNIYVYQGSSIEAITFDRFNMQSTLIISGVVKRVYITRGVLELCNQIVFRSLPSNVIINGQSCEPDISTPATSTTSKTTTLTTQDDPNAEPTSTHDDPNAGPTSTHSVDQEEQNMMYIGWMVGFFTSLIGTVGCLVWTLWKFVQKRRRRNLRLRRVVRQRAFSERMQEDSTSTV